MAASYPTSIKSFTTKNAGDTIQPGHVNDLQDEVVAIETDLLEAYTSYVPTFGGSVTEGDGTKTGFYRQLGKFVMGRATFVLGSTSSVSAGPSSPVTITLPVNADFASVGFLVADGRISDSGGTIFAGHVTLGSATTLSLYYLGASSQLTFPSSTSPITFSSGDSIEVFFIYATA